MGVGYAKLLRGADLESIEGIDSSGNVLLPSPSPRGLLLHQKCLELHEKVEGGSLEQQVWVCCTWLCSAVITEL